MHASLHAEEFFMLMMVASSRCYCSKKSGCRSVNDVMLFPSKYHLGHFDLR